MQSEYFVNNSPISKYKIIDYKIYICIKKHEVCPPIISFHVYQKNVIFENKNMCTNKFLSGRLSNNIDIHGR